MNKGRNTNVVILHGWKLNSKRYKPLSHRLEEDGYKVFVPDMPGNGVVASPKKPYTLDDYVEYIRKYLVTNKIRRCILICHSFGGRVGIKLTASNSNLVSKLVLTGVPGVVPVSSIRIAVFLMLAKIGNAILSLPGLSSTKNFARRVLYRLANSSDYYHTDGIMRQTFKNVIKADLVKPMKMLNVPVQLIWGEDDYIISLDIAKKMKAIIRNSKLTVIPDAGHDVIWTRPAKFIREISSK